MKRKHDSAKFPDIEAKIRSGEYTCRAPSDAKKHTATTWKFMKYIYDESEQILPDFFHCSKCHMIFNLKLRDSGKVLKNHVDKDCNGRATGIEAYFVPEHHPMRRRKICVEDKIGVREAGLAFVIQDMRPISSLNGEGLASLLSKFTYIGAKYGALTGEALNELKLIPSRQTVSVLNCFSLETDSKLRSSY